MLVLRYGHSHEALSQNVDCNLFQAKIYINNFKFVAYVLAELQRGHGDDLCFEL